MKYFLALLVTLEILDLRTLTNPLMLRTQHAHDQKLMLNTYIEETGCLRQN